MRGSLSAQRLFRLVGLRTATRSTSSGTPASELSRLSRRFRAAFRAAAPEGLLEASIAVGLAALILPQFALHFALWHQPTHAFDFAPMRIFERIEYAQRLLMC